MHPTTYFQTDDIDQGMTIDSSEDIEYTILVLIQYTSLRKLR